jgi:hypothetical protein
MKKILVLAAALIAAAGCAPAVKERQFTLIVDPPDAQIEVIGQGGQPAKPYRSPARISIPADQAAAAQSRIVISRKDYKSTVLQLKNMQGDSSIRIKLLKAVQYRLKYSLAGPVNAPDLTFRDNILAVTITPRDLNFDLKIENLAGKPIAMLWDMADYTDARYQRHKIFPSTIKAEERGGRIPAQTIPAGGSLQVSVTPVDALSYAGEKGYVIKPLFELDNDSALSLKGKTVSIFLPIQIDRAIIPNYIFKIKIEDVVKE